MRAHIAEPSQKQGWVKAKFLKCMAGGCGYCSQCDGQLPSYHAEAKAAKEALEKEDYERLKKVPHTQWHV
jgi:aerobic-type carbon monoxide dehydrogenase small subunit (CoxS/CutS family)